jgi:hypothetical protein
MSQFSTALPACPPLPQTFKVDLAHTRQIMESPAGQEVQRRGLVMAGESGIFTPQDVAFVQSGALIGASGCEVIRLRRHRRWAGGPCPEREGYLWLSSLLPVGVA